MLTLFTRRNKDSMNCKTLLDRVKLLVGRLRKSLKGTDDKGDEITTGTNTNSNSNNLTARLDDMSDSENEEVRYFSSFEERLERHQLEQKRRCIEALDGRSPTSFDTDELRELASSRQMDSLAIACLGQSACHASRVDKMRSLLSLQRRTFKKDCRVWLHKSSKGLHTTEREGVEVTSSQQQASSDDQNGDEYVDELILAFSAENNRHTQGGYKKDTRTWLHKSSNKTKEMKDEERLRETRLRSPISDDFPIKMYPRLEDISCEATSLEEVKKSSSAPMIANIPEEGHQEEHLANLKNKILRSVPKDVTFQVEADKAEVDIFLSDTRTHLGGRRVLADLPISGAQMVPHEEDNMNSNQQKGFKNRSKSNYSRHMVEKSNATPNVDLNSNTRAERGNTPRIVRSDDPYDSQWLNPDVPVEVPEEEEVMSVTSYSSHSDVSSMSEESVAAQIAADEEFAWQVYESELRITRMRQQRSRETRETRTEEPEMFDISGDPSHPVAISVQPTVEFPDDDQEQQRVPLAPRRDLSQNRNNENTHTRKK